MTIKNKAYQLYKFDWLASHGYTMEDVIYKVISILDECDFDFKNFNLSGNDAKYVLDLLEETGFNGEIYACYSEFLNNEFQDKEYIRRLLNDTDYQKYLTEAQL